jgi:hypothetical protein
MVGASPSRLKQVCLQLVAYLQQHPDVIVDSYIDTNRAFSINVTLPGGKQLRIQLLKRIARDIRKSSLGTLCSLCFFPLHLQCNNI